MPTPLPPSKSAARVALAYLVLAGLWILASDTLLDLITHEAIGSSFGQTLKGLGFVAFTTLLLYFLLRRPTFSGERRDHVIPNPAAWIPLVTFTLFALGLIATGVFLFHVQREHIRQNSEAQLKAVGDLRIEQVHEWLHNTKANADFFGHNSYLAEAFESWLAAGEKDLAQKQHMLQRLQVVQSAYGYANATLFDLHGLPRLSEQIDPPLVEHQPEVLRVIASGRAELVDFHQHGSTAEPMLGMVAPMLVTNEGGVSRTVGAMFFSIPAKKSLFAMLRHWPTPSVSGETVLMRREGETARLLFASRQPQTSGIGVLIPLGQQTLVATRLVSGESGVLTGAIDYRRQPVLAYGAPITDTPWTLVTKLDQSEVDAPVEKLARGVALVTGLLLLATGLVVWLWWRAQANRQRAQLLSKELERRVLERHYDYLSRYSSDVILMLDMQGNILDINERVREMYGYAPEELIGALGSQLRPPELRGGFDEISERLLVEEELVYETLHQRKDGSQFTVEASARLIDESGLQRVHVSLRDISERKAAEEQLHTQSLVLDQIQDQVTITDLNGVITYVNEAQCRGSGYPREALLGQSVEIYGNDPAAEASQAEIGRITRESGHWRGRLSNINADGSRKYIDLRASQILDAAGRPLCMVGVGTDMTERIKIEEALQEREQRYRAAIETSADGFWMTDAEGCILEVNDAYCGRSGYSREELLGMRISDLEVQEDPQAFAEHAQKLMQGGSDLFETVHRAKDGASWQVEVNASASPLQGGRFFVFLRDILLRNRSEALLRTRLQLSDLAVKGSQDDLIQTALDAAEVYTGSQVGFFHFVDADQEDLVLQTWSTNTVRNMCSVEVQNQVKGQHYPITQAGVWADAVRLQQAQFHNDYASLPDRKGLPEGHAPLLRELVAPILRGGKVVAVLGIGNKSADYTADDLAVVEQIASMLMDVVGRKRAEIALLETNARLQDAQRIAQIGNWEFDVQADKVTWSQQICMFAGRDPADMPFTREAAASLYHPDDVAGFEQLITLALLHGEPAQQELRMLRPDGEMRTVWGTCQAETGRDGKVIRLYGTLQDISERKQSEAQLEIATHFDQLTGLPNARKLLAELAHEMGNVDQAGMDMGSERLALLVLNLDRFAQLNETLGRAAGDRVLVSLAQRWRAALPATTLLARLDADQFAVLIREEMQPGDEHTDVLGAILETANDLLTSMAEPINMGGDHAQVALTLSIGISVYPGDATDAAALLHAAEDAMRIAKADKGNQVRFFDRAQAQVAIDWFETEAALRKALEGDELFLAYQPQVEASSGRVVAAESLLRWRHDGQVVQPGRFIHVVEGTDLAEPVSRWVLQAACRQARQWFDRNRPVRVAVNIFSDHVTSGRLLDDVRHALAVSGLPPELLEIEVVESSLLKKPEIAAHTLREIKRLGVGLALDDFGTGYSSLGYLKHYPFDVLKIDQMFARNVTRDPEDAAIVRSTIALAHNLGMRVLAEGVETEPQLRFMTRYGCDQIQGYLTSRPIAPEALETLVMERRDLRPAGLQLNLPINAVLIVEDEPVEAEMLVMLLQDAGYATHAVADLHGALAVMGKHRIDLVISDHYLEHITGVDVLERLRRLFPDVPGIMVSGADEQSVVIEAVNRAGIRAFLHKPVDGDLLLERVHELLAETAH